MEGWHLDKRVNVSIITALIAQAIVLGMYIGGVARDVQDHGKRIESLELRRETATASDAKMVESLARVDEQLRSTVRILDRQQQSIEKIQDRLSTGPQR